MRSLSSINRSRPQLVVCRLLQPLHDLIEVEGLRLLARREFFERRDELPGYSLRSEQQVSLVSRPEPVRVGGGLRPLKGVHAQIEEQR